MLGLVGCDDKGGEAGRKDSLDPGKREPCLSVLQGTRRSLCQGANVGRKGIGVLGAEEKDYQLGREVAGHAGLFPSFQPEFLNYFSESLEAGVKIKQ
jgi:hypothetical protein